MVVCCCAMANTAACLTCANRMSGIIERYPAPYYWGVDPEGKRQEEAAREKTLDLLRIIEEARQKAAQSTLHFKVTTAASSCP